MFVLLTRVLLWFLIAVVVYVVLLRLLPKKLLTAFGTVAFLLVVILAFLNPNEELVVEAWQILSVPITPLRISLLLILITLTLIDRGGIKAPGRLLLAIAFGILLLSSLPFVAYELAQATEQEVVALPQRRQEVCAEDCPVPLTSTGVVTPSAIALLGKGTTEANLPYRTQIQLTDTGDRVLYTAQLYQQQRTLGNTPFVIVSAGPRANLTGEEDQRLEARDIALLLEQLGVDRRQILLEPAGVDLRTSALEIEKLLTERGLVNQPIYVVTRLGRLAIAHGAETLYLRKNPTKLQIWKPCAAGFSEKPSKSCGYLRDQCPSSCANLLKYRFTSYNSSDGFLYLSSGSRARTSLDSQ